jgi:hypothetical protein
MMPVKLLQQVELAPLNQVVDASLEQPVRLPQSKLRVLQIHQDPPAIGTEQHV